MTAEHCFFIRSHEPSTNSDVGAKSLLLAMNTMLCVGALLLCETMASCCSLTIFGVHPHRKEASM